MLLFETSFFFQNSIENYDMLNMFLQQSERNQKTDTHS